MQIFKAKPPLETATNIAVLLVAIIVVSAFSWGYFIQKRVPSMQSGLQKGRVLANVASIDYGSSPHTLLIIMSTNCRFCTENISFYDQLDSLQRQTHFQTRIFAIFPDKENPVRQYVQQNNINAGITVKTEADLDSLNVNSRPTLILINNKGEILNFWIGKLSEDAQQEVVRVISSS